MEASEARAQLHARLAHVRATTFNVPHEAIAAASEAEELAAQLGDEPLRVEAMLQRATACLTASQFDVARSLADVLERLPVAPAQRAGLLRVRAILAQRSGDLAAALRLANEGLVMVSTLGAEAAPVATSLHNVAANVLTLVADPAGAIDHYLKALELQRLYGGERRRENSAILQSNIGLAYRELQQWADAENAFLQALEELQVSGYVRAIVLGNLGLVRAEHGRASEAIAPLRQALALCEGLEHPRGIGTMHHNLGVALHAAGELDAAEAAYLTALEVRARVGEALDTLETRIRYASLLVDMGGHAEAEQLVLQVLESPASRDWHRRRAEAHQVLFRSYRQRGDFERALHHHEAYHAACNAWNDDRGRHRAELLRARLHSEQVAREREAERAQLDELARLSRTDALTGVANRRRSDELLAAMLETGEPFAVALLDVDRFKAVNDTHSHAVGDTVLREVAGVIQRRLRAGDTVARFGGEEFVVYFPGAAVGPAQNACERLRVAIERHDWGRVAPGLAVTASLGVTGARRGDPAEAVLGRADAALYVAKRSGRNRVVAAEPSPLPEG